MLKSCLTLVLGLTCIMSAIRVQAGYDASSRVSLLTRDDAAAVQGAACEMHVINSKDVCTGDDSWDWCTGPGGFCASSTCGWVCSKEAGQNYRRWWPATNVCSNVISSTKDCPASYPTQTCFTGTLWVCYCANPVIGHTCAANTYTSWTTCN